MIDRVEGKNSFPKWMRFFSFVIGFLLIGDGMRRFAVPSEARDLHAFMMYFLVGAACLLITGYSRKLALDSEGLVREINIWGRLTRQSLISWGQIEKVIFVERKYAFLVCFEGEGKGFRMQINRKDNGAVQNLIDRYANGLYTTYV